MKSSGELTIGELARRFGLATHVLRHWESEGLLAPGRADGGQRRYGAADVERIAMILIAKEAGFGLAEIRELLSLHDPKDRSELLLRQVAVLADRIAKATAAKELIEEAMACPLPFETCPHARAHIAARIPDSLLSFTQPSAGRS